MIWGTVDNMVRTEKVGRARSHSFCSYQFQYLALSGGTFEAVQPIHRHCFGILLDIQNDSTSTGLLISDGIKLFSTGSGATT
jgi:hypothetical protein